MLPLKIRMNGQSADECRGYTAIAREFFSHLLWDFVCFDCERAKSIETRHLPRFFADRHKNRCYVSSLILSGLLAQVSIQRLDTARKSRPVMMIIERLDGRRRFNHSLGKFFVPSGGGLQGVIRLRRIGKCRQEYGPVIIREMHSFHFLDCPQGGVKKRYRQ